MALSGSFYLTRSSGTQYLQGRVEWSATQSTASNKSTVTTKLIFRRTNEGYETWGDGTFTLTVNGQNYSESKHYNFTSSDNVILTATTVIEHNSDGKKSFTISASYSGNSPIGGSGSQSFDLNTIPRASSISSSIGFYAGDALSVSINRASSSFTHDVQVVANGTSVKTVTGVGASATISFTDAEVNTLVSKSSGGSCPITLNLTTKSGSTTVGTSSKSGSCYVRPSTITSSPDFTIGSTIPVAISRSSSNYTHTVQLLVNGSVITSSTNAATSCTLSPTAATLYAKTPNSNSLAVTLRCITYRGSAKIGQADVAGTARVNAETAKPVFSNFTYADVSTAASVTGNNQTVISGISNVRVTITTANKATSSTGATIQKYIFSCGGKSVEAAYTSTASVTLTLNAVTSSVLSVTAVDSRGNQKVVTKSVSSFVEYTRPVINKVELIRENGVGEKVTFNFTGSIYSAKKLGNVDNGVKTLSYKWRRTGSTAWTTGGTGLPAQTAYTGAIRGDLSGGFTSSQSFDVLVSFTDKLTTTEQQFQLNSGVPVMDLYRSGNRAGVAVGQKFNPSDTAQLQVPGGVSADSLKVSNQINAKTLQVTGGVLADYLQSGIKSGILKADSTGRLIKASFSDFSEGLQYGSNTYGNWVKFPGGLLIQWGSFSAEDATDDRNISGSYKYSVTFPVAFSSVPVVLPISIYPQGRPEATLREEYSTRCVILVSSKLSNITVRWVAIGI